MILPVPLTAEERRVIQSRVHVLAQYVAPAARREIETWVLQMLAGFGAGRNEESAAATAAQYVKVLEGLPLFAIAKSCQRWARGAVTPDEVGAQKLDRAFPPSTAFVRIVAENVARSTIDEATIGNMLLRARALQEVSEDERKRVGEKMVELAEEWQRKADDENSTDPIESQVREDSRRRLKELSERSVLAEYERAGVPPVYADPERTMLVSLSMLLAGGWRIEQMMGRNVLTRATGQMQEAE